MSCFLVSHGMCLCAYTHDLCPLGCCCRAFREGRRENHAVPLLQCCKCGSSAMHHACSSFISAGIGWSPLYAAAAAVCLQACPLNSSSPVVQLMQRCELCPTSQGCLSGTSMQHMHLHLLLCKPADAVCCYNRWAEISLLMCNCLLRALLWAEDPGTAVTYTWAHPAPPHSSSCVLCVLFCRASPQASMSPTLLQAMHPFNTLVAPQAITFQ
jgi:hypothetical protein